MILVEIVLISEKYTDIDVDIENTNPRLVGEQINSLRSELKINDSISFVNDAGTTLTATVPSANNTVSTFFMVFGK